MAVVTHGESTAEQSPATPFYRAWLPHVLAGLGLCGAVFCFYFGYLEGTAFIWEDMLFWYYPATSYVCSALAEGRFPLWTAAVQHGTPFYTDLQTSLYYPLLWLLVPLVSGGSLPIEAYQWYVVLHVLLGGGLMYLFLAHRRLPALACLVGAVIFCFAGFSALHVIHFPMLQVYAWLPLQLLFVDRIVTTRRAGSYVLLTLTIFISLLAGFPQITLYNSYFVMAYWLYRRWAELRRMRVCSGRQMAVQLGSEWLRMAGVFGSVLLLSSFAWLPSLEHWSLGPRGKWDFNKVAAQSMPGYYLLQFLVPNFFGESNQSGSLPFWGFNKHGVDVLGANGRGPFQYWDFGAYAGQLAILAAAVFLGKWRQSRADLSRFVLGVSAAALWFMLGRHGGLFAACYYVLPGTALFRGPARMACVLDFCLALLAAMFVGRLLVEKTLRVTKPILAVAALYALVTLAYLTMGKQLFPELNRLATDEFAQRQLLISALLFAGTAAAVWALQPVRHRLARFSGICALALLVFGDLYLAYNRFHRGPHDPEKYHVADARVLTTFRQLRQLHGPIRFTQLRDGHYPEDVLVDENTPLVQPELRTVRGYMTYYLDENRLLGQLTNIETRLDLQNIGLIANYDSAKNVAVLQARPQTLPRARFYPHVAAYQSNEEILAALDSGTLDHRRTLAVLRRELATTPLAISPSSLAAPVQNVGWWRVSPEEFRLRYAVDQPGIIFVSESFYPGWEAVDRQGRDYPIIHAFIAFKGIVIPEAGAGELIVRFRPRPLRLGLMISSLTLVVLTAFYLFLGRRQHHAGIRVP